MLQAAQMRMKLLLSIWLKEQTSASFWMERPSCRTRRRPARGLAGSRDGVGDAGEWHGASVSAKAMGAEVATTAARLRVAMVAVTSAEGESSAVTRSLLRSMAAMAQESGGAKCRWRSDPATPCHGSHTIVQQNGILLAFEGQPSCLSCER